MKKDEVIERVKELNLPKNSYIVFGSCPMALAGVRDCNDIDLLVTSEIYQAKKQEGWEVIDKGPNDHPAVSGVFELHDMWDFSSYSPTLEHLLATASWVEGVPFAALDEVRTWKVASARPKDLEDIQLIDRL